MQKRFACRDFINNYRKSTCLPCQLGSFSSFALEIDQRYEAPIILTNGKNGEDWVDPWKRLKSIIIVCPKLKAINGIIGHRRRQKIG